MWPMALDLSRKAWSPGAHSRKLNFRLGSTEMLILSTGEAALHLDGLLSPAGRVLLP